MVVTGDPALQGKVRAHVATWLQQHGFTINAKALAPDALKTLTSCFVIEDMACARGVVEHQATSDFLVFVRAELVGGKRSKEANLVAYWFLKDRDAAVDKRNCKPCTGAVLAKTTGELIGAIYDETALAKARLAIKEPPGLVVMLDGVNVGVTPIEQDVAPGAHQISLVRDEVTLGGVSLDVKAGDLTDVKVPIKPPDAVASPGHPRPPPPPEVRADPVEHRSHLVPGVILVAGAATVVTGGVFLYYGHKGGPDDPLIYPHATRQGAIIAGAGGAAVIAGLLLWWHASASANGPTASVTPAVTMIGWAGQF